MAIVKQEQQAIERRSPQHLNQLKVVLTGLAEARQAAITPETLKLYAHHLAKYEPSDVKLVVQRIATRKRAEGDTAFPSLGDLVEPLDGLRERRLAVDRERMQRGATVAEFWRLMPQWIEITGETEEQILERWPSMKGTKPAKEEAA